MLLRNPLSPSEIATLVGENKALKTLTLSLRKRICLLESREGSCLSSKDLDKYDSFDDLYITSSGDTEETMTSRGSSMSQVSFGKRLDLTIDRKKLTFERLARSMSEEEDRLRSKESLMDTSEEEGLILNAGDEIAQTSKRQGSKATATSTINMRKSDLSDEIAKLEAKRAALQFEISQMEEDKALLSLRNADSYLPTVGRAGIAGPVMIEMTEIRANPRQQGSSPSHLKTLMSEMEELKSVAKKCTDDLSTAKNHILGLKKDKLVLIQELDSLKSELSWERKSRRGAEKDLQLLMKETEQVTKERDEARLVQHSTQLDENNQLRSNIELKEAMIRDLRKKIGTPCKKDNTYAEICSSQKSPLDKRFSGIRSSEQNSDSWIAKSKNMVTHERSHDAIRIHAAKTLFFASRAIEKGCTPVRSNQSSASSITSSIASSNASEFKPDVRDIQNSLRNFEQNSMSNLTGGGRPPLAARPDRDEQDCRVIISNIDTVSESPLCSCQTSLFSGNAAHVEFYLPKLGMACECGLHKAESSTLDGTDPSSLTNILRPWQVDFLRTLNIRSGVELVHAFKQDGNELAKEMRKWRREKSFPSVKTKSCHVALHIWCRTCKAVIRSIRKQKAEGATVFQKPDFMEINLADSRTVSTLGYDGSVIIDMKSELAEV